MIQYIGCKPIDSRTMQEGHDVGDFGHFGDKSSGEVWKLIWTVVINALSFSGLDPSKVSGSLSQILAVGMRGQFMLSAEVCND